MGRFVRSGQKVVIKPNMSWDVPPRGGSPSDVVEMGSLIISPDVVAADTAGAMMLGHKQGEIEHIRLAAAAGHGEMDLSKLKIERLTV
jgi:uncharacterized protein (DUF362 family)